MHSLKKVILLTIIFILVAAIVLPATVSLLENFNISSQNIFNFLSAITDSMIVKASDTDYEYSGNLGIWEEKNSLYIYSGGNSKILQYSIDGSDFSDFEYTDSHSKGSSKTDYIEINNEVKTVVVRDKEKKIVLLRGLLINNGNYLIGIYYAKVGWSMGNRITLGNDNSKNLEYSINNGIDFLDIPINPYWGEGFSGNLFSEKIIIRTKDTKEIIYKTPNISEISEKYTYENGKTNVTFSLNGNASNQAKYKYYIKDEELSGNNIDVKNDVSIKLMASDIKDFVTQTKEKEINVKVIKTEKPSIKVNEENELILDEGIITNDKLGNIYYSIDGGEFNIYANKVKLSSGTHTIKAYQITSENKVKSDIETVNVTIEEKKPEDNNQTDKDEENNKEENEQINKDENTNNANNKNDGTDNEQKNVLKSENKNIPKTGDAISIYAVAIFVIITLNLVVRKKRKK